MPWLRYWLVASLVYSTPLGLLLLAHPAYQTWQNAAVVVGPPAIVYLLAWAWSKRGRHL
jgi:hypothetical protein